MKSISTKEIRAAGVNQTWLTAPGDARDIVNCRLDPTGYGWINDKGWEPADTPRLGAIIPNPTYISADKSALYIWQRHRGAEVYKIHKTSDGEMVYVHSNDSIFPRVSTVAFDRTPAKSDDADEQYAPYGRFLCIVNGKDIPLKFWGREKTLPFGFTKRTPAPELIGPDPEFFQGSADFGAGTTSYPELEADKFGLAFSTGTGLGLGFTADDKVNTYGYCVSFITDTGSESPLSQINYINWTNAADNNFLGYSVLLNIPQGPPGTVARRIYRTKTLGDVRNETLVDGAQLFYLKQVNDNTTKNFVDTIPDDILLTPAPSEFDSSVISSTYKYNASWDNRMWLAGGQGNETRIIYSQQGLPEQFGSFNYYDVGNTSGGAITQIFPYYDNLLIFREHAIDVLRPANNTQYVLSRLYSKIGTNASNTITNIPDLGVVFLSYDGVYLINGGVLGGSKVQVQEISQKITTELDRLSKTSLARATAAYSRKEKEWWVCYPVDGNTENTRCSVLHVADGISWSFRHDLSDASTTMENSFAINSLDTLPDGTFIAAFRNLTSVSGGPIPIPVITTEKPGVLQVWTGNRGGDNSTSYSYNGESYTFGVQITRDIVSEWKSAWLDFGDDSVKKRVLSVEVEVVTKGHNEIELLTAVDYRDDGTTAGTRPTAVAEQYGTTNEDSIYNPTIAGPFDKSIAVIGTSQWGEARTARLRWDVNTGLVSWFRFSIRSSSYFQIVSYQLEYVDGQRKTINIPAGRGNTR